MASIIIVGLGPGPSEALTREAGEAVLQAVELHIAGGCEPGCDTGAGTCLCPQLPDVDAAALAAHVVERAKKGADVTLSVPGDPADWQALLQEMDELATPLGIVVRRVSGVSLVSPVLAALGFAALPGLYLTTAAQLASRPHPSFAPDCPVLVMQLRSSSTLAALQKTLLNQYRPDFRVALAHSAGRESEMVKWVALGELSASTRISHTSALFLPPGDEMDGFGGLQAIVAQLRGPDGCPWDQEQTHRSLRANLLEEAYETLAAIDSGDRAALVEELGDLLLQVVMHAQIAVDEGEFDVVTLVSGINKKLVRRHPHVFAGLSVEGVENVLRKWDEIKAAENSGKAREGGDSALSGVPIVLPALAQAQTNQRRAARVGFDWAELDGVLEKIQEEIEELRSARGSEQKTAETGDLLFTLVNMARWLDVDAESALREANARFRSRFEAMETRIGEQGGKIREQSPAGLNALWARVKEIKES
ncbi:MAG: nucleoside triphosphate pyrophosphohydrolase [Anaerolineales bacterium]|nr:nucleoside triphosphate pyrophosphohydrolase [Anaerolineales bacterium]